MTRRFGPSNTLSFMKKSYGNNQKEFDIEFFPGRESGFVLYKEKTNSLDKDRVNNFKVLKLNVELTIGKLFGDAFLQKAENGAILPEETTAANLKLANYLYDEKLTKLILEEKIEGLVNLSEQNLQKFMTNEKQTIAGILESVGLSILVVRPEMYYLSNKIEKFLLEKGFGLVDSFDHQLNFKEYWALYSEHLIEKEPFNDFPTRTLVYLASKCKILLFSRNGSNHDILHFKGERGSVMPGTLRGDVITKESLYLLNSGLLSRKDIFFTLDPINSYRHIVSGKIKSDNIHKKYNFPFLFYAITGLHIPDYGEAKKDLCVLLSAKQLKKTLSRILADNNSLTMRAIQNFDTINLIRSGECDVYVIRKNRRKVFLKVKGTNSRFNFDAEAFALKSLAKLGAKVSGVVRRSDSFIITSENLGKCIDDRPRLFLKKTIYKDLSEDLQKFYSVKFNGFGPIENSAYGRGKYKKWIDFFEDIKAWMKIIKNRGMASIKSVEVLEKYWQQNSSRLKDVKKSYLVHGDFCLDHVFAFQGHYSGIIDFGDTFAGDPLMDLAYFKFKEIAKTYGPKTFELLREPYEKYRTIGASETKLINLYMIYWAFRRVKESNDPDMAKTFAKKLERLAIDLEKVT